MEKPVKKIKRCFIKNLNFYFIGIETQKCFYLLINLNFKV